MDAISLFLHQTLSHCCYVSDALDFVSIDRFESLEEETLERLHGHRREEGRASWDHALIELKLRVVEVVPRSVILGMLRASMPNPGHE